VYDHPFLWGSRRIGPDLAREGGKYPNLWHVRHMQDPRAITPRSIMPAYPGMLTDAADFAGIQKRVDAMAMLGVPYGDLVKGGAEEAAREQARIIADDIVANGGPDGLADKEIVPMIAYLQRLGIDIKRTDATALATPVGGR
jgi:cytochrome c oxidase cbb3-type subunit I/II